MTWQDDMYRAGTPPWEIGRPQPAIRRLHTRGGFQGRVLDLGCGTGGNAIWLARQGFHVTGLDASSLAIARARAKADNRGVDLDLRVGDALDLHSGFGIFDTVLDCGLFHALGDEARLAWRASLAAVMRPGSVAHILCMSDREPEWGGPRRISQAELRALLGPDWHVDRVVAEALEHLLSRSPAAAWMVSVTRIGRIVGTES